MAGPGQRQRVQTLFEGMGALGQATQQVARLGSDEQVERARRTLDEARRRIYRILAEDESADPTPAATEGRPDQDGQDRAEPGAGA
jgi:exonuclease VII small subunit